ncbi:hypothetical protein BASA60_001740 [Batrachochytrium salamandrivorans]|nr:hypothetical protein BASA60_001740 [Batrachochytrium salamandrivorans]KAH9248006.1 hypothetical protein BASA81_014381 [Batrachochytrium salamandrivorans]
MGAVLGGGKGQATATATGVIEQKMLLLEETPSSGCIGDASGTKHRVLFIENMQIPVLFLIPVPILSLVPVPSLFLVPSPNPISGPSPNPISGPSPSQL